MKFIENITSYIPCAQKPEVNVGKIVFKTVAITAAVFAFVPTVIKVNKGKGFDAYAPLTHVKYEKSTAEDGKVRRDITVHLLDLERYGVSIKGKAQTEEENEDSSCIEE